MPENKEENRVVVYYEIILWIVAGVLLYLVSLKNYLLFHTLAEFFSIFVAYVIFLIVWKSRERLENRFLVFIGIAYFFVANLDLIHTFTYRGIEIFPQYDTNIPTQLWIAARYMESLSLLIASLLLINTNKNNGKKFDLEGKEKFFWRTFFVYAGITTGCFLSILFFRNFPDSYIEGSGLTRFKIISEYVISFILLCSLTLLYSKRERFEEHIYGLIAASIVATIFGELAFTLYIDVYGFFNFLGHFFKMLSFYFIYKAVIETGFDDPYTLLFRELRESEEALRRETVFLRDDQGKIYSLLGVKRDNPRSGVIIASSEIGEKADYPLVQNIRGHIVFKVDKNFKLLVMDGAVEEITGYSKEDFLSDKRNWVEIIMPEDRSLALETLEKVIADPDTSIEIEYRIKKRTGDIRWVWQILQRSPADSGTRGPVEGLIRDISERKMAEETLQRIDQARIKEIHHRIKNNLQVISSLLSLEAERFSDAKMLEAFRESQNRVTSMAIIHEELYKGDEIDTLDFADYLRKLTADLFNSYRVGNEEISLKLELDKVYLGMDTAIPLGIIVNELVSNALKHAFPSGRKGEIVIFLSRTEDYEKQQKPEGSWTERNCPDGRDLQFALAIEDNGKGFPAEYDFKNPHSLGLELVNILVEQIDGCIALQSNGKTRFIIWFSNKG
ncbi:PAS domain S-box protein [Methanosarcina sp. MSH10X1]|uniref:MASE3 domain-containing protein n=1 Tax=Methanosarcina sp. MSH10X1 TaxID=2507075 RepID=UPI000FFBCE7E|nr:MASE3 domain-containing protein [Methanosarcina sp. MSH10X1]RXA19602.1 PAS domain S-box protein [Methanosarcina sp. MSH10X1]